MKVALVVDGLGIGGIERVCVDYIKLLLELGYDVTLINLSPSNAELKDELPSNVIYRTFKFPKNFVGERYAQLIKMYMSGKFLYPLIYIILKCYKWIVLAYYRLLHHEHFDFAIAFSGHFNDLAFVADGFLKTTNKIAWLHGALYEYILISDGYFNLYKKIVNLVCLVNDAQEETLVYNHYPNLNIHKLYNPTFILNKKINSQKVKNIKKRFGKFILMVSRFEYPHKDQYTVCKSFEILRKKYNEDINLVFIGDGPDKENVIKYASKLGEDIFSHIYFLGAKRDVQNYYKAAYLLVHASVAGEGLPTVQIEALSYELPQVVTDSKVGPREILGDNKYGLLCRIKDPLDMADKVEELLSNRDLYQHYKNVSSERIKDFEPNAIKGKLNEILKNIDKKSDKV